MKYYSEVTNKLYESEKDLLNAEKNVKEMKEAKEKKDQKMREERAARAKEVEEALAAAREANSKATKLLSDFTKDYGQFHMSLRPSEDNRKAFNVFDFLFDFI